VTVKVEAHLAPYNIGNRRVIFVDTPGFDDTERSDTEVLREIVHWLSVTYKDGIKLTGVVYLHGIQVPRVTGTARTNLRLFQKLCGDESMSSIALATTHWSYGTEERRKQLTRHKELIADDAFWKLLIENGAKDFIHDRARESALEVVLYLLGRRPHGGMELKIQQEMDSGISLENTEAGMAVEKILEEIKAKYNQELDNLRKELEEARQQNNWTDEQRKADIDKVTEELNVVQKKLKKMSVGKDRLRVDMEKLVKQREEELRMEAEKLQQEHEDEVRRIKAEKTANEASLKTKFEEEKRKRKELLAKIRQAQGCRVM
jgi:hypothetical protein